MPGARVWVEPGADAVTLAEALGGRRTLLCFYFWDWSPG